MSSGKKKNNDEIVPLSTPMSELIRQINMAMKAQRKTIEQVPSWVCTPRYLRLILNGHRPNLNPGMTAKICTWLRFDSTVSEHMNELSILSLEPEWWDKFKEGMRADYWLYLQRQDACDRTSSYDFTYVPTLLQHPLYYEGLFQRRKLWPDPVQDFDQSIALRDARQRRWFDSGRPLSAVIGEPALLLDLGDDVMEAQRKHLMEMSQRPGMDIRVARLGGPWYDIIGTEFDILHYDSSPDEAVIRVFDKQASRYVSPRTHAGEFFTEGFQHSQEASESIEEYLNNE